MRVWPGAPYPLGATWDGAGINFALFSENATRVELCLFDSAGASAESARIELPERTDQVFHAYLPDLMPGQLYGYRVHGPWDPNAGHRFNPAKVVFDPYGKAVGRMTRWGDELFGYRIGAREQDLARDDRNSAAHAPLAEVIQSAFPWGDDRPLRTPWHKTLIYEAHVKGTTRRHPDVPEPLRGTYLGMASEPIIDHLTSLGVTAVELLPVHHHVDDRHLIEHGLRNYWGYNTLGFFAPDARYAAPVPMPAVMQFKTMVRNFHRAGIEVILDVVYNHTAEGNHLGPTLSMRGVDNRSYYRLSPESARYHMDFTGCGNTLNMQHPRVLQLIMDSLRYWVLEMHVDGFRFDLASTLARELYEVDKLGVPRWRGGAGTTAAAPSISSSPVSTSEAAPAPPAESKPTPTPTTSVETPPSASAVHAQGTRPSGTSPKVGTGKGTRTGPRGGTAPCVRSWTDDAGIKRYNPDCLP